MAHVLNCNCRQARGKGKGSKGSKGSKEAKGEKEVPNWRVDLFACKSVCNSRPMINANRRKGAERGSVTQYYVYDMRNNIEDDTVWP